MTRSQALYLKWRPTTFANVVGQDHVVQTISNAVVSDRAVHAYLFCGPRGTGKTTLARLLAKALNCTSSDLTKRPCSTCPPCIAIHEGRFLDLIEIDAASNNSVEDVRDLRGKINFAPGQGRFKVYIIDEVHMLSGAAFNALLKTLEEPPQHAIFVLATTEVHKLPLTVTSRCQQHNFRRISIELIVERLGMIVSEEGMSVEPAVLEIVARQATGSLRDAISLLDQLVISPDIIVTVDRAHEVLGTVGDRAVLGLVQAMLEGQADHGLDMINTTFDDGSDPNQFARQMVDYLRGVLLCKLGNLPLVEASGELKDAMQDHARRFQTSLLLRALHEFDGAAQDKRGSWLGQLPLELAYLKCMHPELASNSGSTVKVAPRPVHLDFPPDSVATAKQPIVEPDEEVQLHKKGSAGGPSLEQEDPDDMGSAHGEQSRGAEIMELHSRWNEVVECSRTQHHSLPALLEWCQPVRVTDQTVFIGVRQEFAKSRLENHQMRAGLEESISDVTGHALRVQFTRSDIQSNLDELDVDEDGVVALGVELGARPRQR